MLTEDDKQWVTEQLRGMETRLLTAFREWATPAETRVRSHSAVLRALDIDLEMLQKRVSKLEPPPPQQ